MAYKKKKHQLLLKDSIMAYKKKKNHLFSEDCVQEILLKLPIKSILRFKCVSKSWYTLLISSYFINTHVKLNEKTKLLFINTHKHKFLSFNIKDKSFVSKLNHRLEFHILVGCCNGIICFRSNGDNIILLNPSIMEVRELPPFARLLDIRVRSIGFGFNDLNNDYKVILILSVFHREIRKGHPYTYETAIYNLRSNIWRKLENENRSTTSGYVVPISYSLFFNGRVHWDAYDSYYESYYEDTFSYIHPMVLSMDINSEFFYEFQYPESVLLWKKKNKDYSTFSYQTNLQVIRGYLSVILFRMLSNYFYSDSEQYINIWSMKEYGVIETWSKQYTIGPYVSITRALSIRENEEEENSFVLMRVLSIRGNEDKEEEEDLLLQIGTKLVRWNLLKNEEVQKYCLEDFHVNMETSCYSQSLVSIVKNNLDYI